VGSYVVVISTHRNTVVVEPFIIEQAHPACTMSLAPEAADSFRELALTALMSFVDKERAKEQEDNPYSSGGCTRYYSSAFSGGDRRRRCRKRSGKRR